MDGLRTLRELHYNIATARNFPVIRQQRLAQRSKTVTKQTDLLPA
jgi:hypothetical protein